jgi:hypothetical protein
VRDRLIYGSFDEQRGIYQVSMDPPDSPTRRVIEVDREQDVTALAKRKRARVFWWPPRKVQSQ